MTTSTPRKAPAKSAGAKQPRDRQAKKLTKAEVEERKQEGFTFVGPDGTEHTLRPLGSLNAGFYRQNRRRDAQDAFFSLLEALADEAALAAIDEMDEKQFEQLTDDLNTHHGITVGDT